MQCILNKFKRALSLILLLILAASCAEDDPVSTQEEHFEAVRMKIFDGGKIIYDFISADYTDQDTYSNDTIYIPLGKTNLLSAKFYNENNLEIDPREEEHTTFETEIGDETIVITEWEQGSEGDYVFYLNGKTAGVTTITFFIMHEGHPDFRTKVNHIVVR
jgi:hypothetical protein